MHEAIHLARNSRGTNDAGNEWIEFLEPAERPHEPHGIQPSVAPAAAAHASDSRADHNSESLFTVTVEDPVTGMLEKALDHNATDQSCIDLSQPSELQQFFDDALWTQACSKIQTILSGGSVFGGFFMHFGLTFCSQFRTAESPFGTKAKNHDMNAQIRSETSRTSMDTCYAHSFDFTIPYVRFAGLR